MSEKLPIRIKELYLLFFDLSIGADKSDRQEKLF
jgi:hypothetical protein